LGEQFKAIGSTSASSPSTSASYAMSSFFNRVLDVSEKKIKIEIIIWQEDIEARPHLSYSVIVFSITAPILRNEGHTPPHTQIKHFNKV
jgi:hypothetical protein